ncbi:MAG: electron transport complex subunit RsxD [Gammaproteobacteria bacterium]|nr:electron transport complex subunit RsxD [Gammaproteobacteria bacterium]
MSLNTPTSPHIHDDTSVTKVMLRVLLALVPAIIAYSWYFGWGLLINIAIAATTALACEYTMLMLRQRPVAPFMTDGSIVVTAILLAFCIPPLAPWWIAFLGTGFAVVVGKHLYGGLGYNPFNPAMVGYVMLLISFPKEMTTWLPPNLVQDLNFGFLTSLNAVFTGNLPAGFSLDGITAATPLDLIKTQLNQDITITETKNSYALFGDFGGIGWEWIGNWVFLGGVWLIYKKVINWHIPVAVLGSLFVISLVFFLMDADYYGSPMFHLFSGAAILGAFFIATDPVSAATTPRGRIIYGIGIGLLTYIIRVWGGYPDGIGFAVLLMNLAAPTIDYYTQPRVYGHKRK